MLRRPKISIKPNTNRGNREGENCSQATPNTSQEPAEKAEENAVTKNEITEPVELLENKSESFPEKPASDKQDVIPSTDQSSEKSKAVSRRPKLQIKPTVSRPSKQNVTVNEAKNGPSKPSLEDGDKAADQSLLEKQDPEKSVIPDSQTLVEGGNLETGQQTEASEKEPAAGDSKEPDSESEANRPCEAVSARPFRPKPKPNVNEANLARLRRFSGSYDSALLSPPPPRRTRQPSMSSNNVTAPEGKEEISYSSIEVMSKEKTNPNSDKSDTGTNGKVESRKRTKSVHETDADKQEIAEAERNDALETNVVVPYNSPPKRKRRVRRTIKSDKAPDLAKMTMKELLWYQPLNNPLPAREPVPKIPSPEANQAKQPEQTPEDLEEEDDAADDAELAPQIMIGDDGEVIINQNSLTVEAKQVCSAVTYEDVLVDRDGEDVTYSSFRTKNQTRVWTPLETTFFYKALAAVGTDFSLMCQLFPKRTRTEIKKKFKKEEKANLHKVQMAMSGKLNFDHEPFPDIDFKQQKQEEKERKKKEKEAKKLEQKKNREINRKYRTYYEVDDLASHRKTLKARRRGQIPLNKDSDSANLLKELAAPSPESTTGSHTNSVSQATPIPPIQSMLCESSAMYSAQPASYCDSPQAPVCISQAPFIPSIESTSHYPWLNPPLMTPLITVGGNECLTLSQM